MQLRDRERRDDTKTLAEGAARVEIGRECNRRARVDERAGRRHRPVEKKGARREEHADDPARGQRSDAAVSCRLEMIDRPSAELDRQPDRALLVELIAV